MIILMVAAIASLALGIKSEVRSAEKATMQFFVLLLQKKIHSIQKDLIYYSNLLGELQDLIITFFYDLSISGIFLTAILYII